MAVHHESLKFSLRRTIYVDLFRVFEIGVSCALTYMYIEVRGQLVRVVLLFQMWVSGIEIKSSGLYTESSHQPENPLFKKPFLLSSGGVHFNPNTPEAETG